MSSDATFIINEDTDLASGTPIFLIFICLAGLFVAAHAFYMQQRKKLRRRPGVPENNSVCDGLTEKGPMV
jgi:hypothetical protein